MQYGKQCKGDKYVQFFIAPREEEWFYERLFFEVVIVRVKDEKKQYKRYNVNKT